MIGYNFTYKAGERTHDEFPKMQQGRWWVWGPGVYTQARLKQMAKTLYEETLIEVVPDQRQRITALDMEGVGTDQADRERIVNGFLDEWQKLSPSKLLVIEFWVGRMGWSMQREAKALLSGPSTPDKLKMYAMAKRHRPIVRKAGIATQIGVVHTPQQIDFFVDWLKAMSIFGRKKYPGTELCAWLCGSYTVVPGNPQMSVEHCNRIADAVWEGFDSFALYGDIRENTRFGSILSSRL